MNPDSAIAFVHQKGNLVEQARLAYVLHHAPASAQIAKTQLDGQRPDGGWPPFWAPDYSSLDATCYRLAQAEQLGILQEVSAASRAAAFLARRQQPEGSWEEEEAIASLAPPWARPGDTAARLYLTANCGFWLAFLDESSSQAGLAGEYLRSFTGAGGRLSSYLHTHWLAAGLWHRLGQPQLAGPVLGYLHRRLPDLPASNLAWMLNTLLIAGLPADHGLVEAAASRLEQCQAEDGRWPGEDGPGQDVHTTLEALRALRLCGRF